MPRRQKTGRAAGRPARAMVLATRAQVLKRYTTGQTPDQIAVALKLKLPIVERYLADALDAMVRHWAKPNPQHTFVRYAAFQMGIIDKLQRSYDHFMSDDDNKQYGACVAALRAQSDIMDKVMTKGNDYGIITARRADKSVQMNQADLRAVLQEEIKLLSTLLQEVDNHDTFTRRRKVALQKEGKQPAPRGKGLARIRKVKRNALGFVTALPDWKYRTRHYDKNMNVIPEHKLTPQQRQTIATASISQTDITLEVAHTEQDEALFNEYEKYRSPSNPSRKVIEVTSSQSQDTNQTRTNKSRAQDSSGGYDVPTDYARE